MPLVSTGCAGHDWLVWTTAQAGREPQPMTQGRVGPCPVPMMKRVICLGDLIHRSRPKPSGSHEMSRQHTTRSLNFRSYIISSCSKQPLNSVWKTNHEICEWLAWGWGHHVPGEVNSTAKCKLLPWTVCARSVHIQCYWNKWCSRRWQKKTLKAQTEGDLKRPWSQGKSLDNILLLWC